MLNPFTADTTDPRITALGHLYGALLELGQVAQPSDADRRAADLARRAAGCLFEQAGPPAPTPAPALSAPRSEPEAPSGGAP